MVRKKGVLRAQETLRGPRGPFCGARVVRQHTAEHPGAKKATPRIFLSFSRAENLTGGPPSPEGSQNRRNQAPARGQLAFWCPRCLRGVVNGYIKSQKHLKATITSQNEQKRAKTSQNRPKSLVSRARTPKNQNLALKVTYLGQKSIPGAHIRRSERFASSGAVCVAGYAPSTR